MRPAMRTLVAERPDWFRRGDRRQLGGAGAGQPERSAPAAGNGRSGRTRLGNPTCDQRRSRISPISPCHFLDLGAAGFRCSSAYKVPPDFWRDHRRAARAAPGCGVPGRCPGLPVRAGAGAGRLRLRPDLRQQPLVGFSRALVPRAARAAAPDRAHRGLPRGPQHSPPGARPSTCMSPRRSARLYRARYLLRGGLACGALMPMGFEFGCRERARSRSRPGPRAGRRDAQRRESTSRDFIAAAQRAEGRPPVLNLPGRRRRVTAPNGRVVGAPAARRGTPRVATRRVDPADQPGFRPRRRVALGRLLTAAGGRITDFRDVTPGVPPLYFDAGEPLSLDPLGVRLFLSEAHGAGCAAARAVEAKPTPELARAVASRSRRSTPEIDGGRFPVKRIVGDVLTVEADIFGDGHDRLAAAVSYRAAGDADWSRAADGARRQRPLGRQPAAHPQHPLPLHGRAWRDLFTSWRARARQEARCRRQPIALELIEGSNCSLAGGGRGRRRASDLRARCAELHTAGGAHGRSGLAARTSCSARTCAPLMRARRPARRLLALRRELEVVVDRTAAAFAAWYELFPRSHERRSQPARHLRRCDPQAALCPRHGLRRALLPADPSDRPREPQGPQQQPDGAARTIPAAPTPSAPSRGRPRRPPPGARHARGFRAAGGGRRRARARDRARLRDPVLARTIPGSSEHPEWFDWRPDGTISYAENPPKKYEDIVNVDFYGEGALPGALAGAARRRAVLGRARV